MRGGKLIKGLDRLPDVLYTSLLRRAITTAHLALDAADRLWIPVHRDWRLNERHYGALQGLDKAETKEKYGEEQFMMWRRSYDTPPPPIERGSKYSQDADPRYADIGGGRRSPSASRTLSHGSCPTSPRRSYRTCAPERRC